MTEFTFVVCLMLLAIVVALFSITKALNHLADVIEKKDK